MNIFLFRHANKSLHIYAHRMSWSASSLLIPETVDFCAWHENGLTDARACLSHKCHLKLQNSTHALQFH